MGYLITQIVLALLIAAALGVVLGWLLRGLAAGRELERQEALWQSRLRRVKQRPSTGSDEGGEPAAPHLVVPGLATADSEDDQDLEAARATVENALNALARQLEGLSDRLERIDQTPSETAGQPPEPDAAAPATTTNAAPTPPRHEPIDELDQAEARIRSTLSEAASAPVGVAPPSHPPGDERRPPATAAAAPPSDDLKRIKGVGPALERALNAVGVTTFAEIAGWSSTEMASVAEKLKEHYRGRIDLAGWKTQAVALARGGETRSPTAKTKAAKTKRPRSK